MRMSAPRTPHSKVEPGSVSIRSILSGVIGAIALLLVLERDSFILKRIRR
jgi:hypothetical protein